VLGCIFARYDHEVETLVILADDNPRWRPRAYRYGRWYSRTELTTEPVKLLDDAHQVEAPEQDANPFALMVLVVRGVFPAVLVLRRKAEADTRSRSGKRRCSSGRRGRQGEALLRHGASPRRAGIKFLVCYSSWFRGQFAVRRPPTLCRPQRRWHPLQPGVSGRGYCCCASQAGAWWEDRPFSTGSCDGPGSVLVCCLECLAGHRREG
jgi:hypothetical protein